MPVSEWSVIAHVSAFVVSSSIPQPARQACVGGSIFVCISTATVRQTQTCFGFIVYIHGIFPVSVD